MCEIKIFFFLLEDICIFLFLIYFVYGEGVCLKFDDFFKKNFIEFYVDI